MKKRIISLLLCLVLTVSLVPAAAAADTGDARTVTVRYASGHGIDTHDYEAAFTYSDDLFTRSGYTYRKDLALMSMGLAFAAYTSKDSEKTDNYAPGNRNFVSMAEQCGFENIQSNKWMFQPAEADSIGISCASKTIRDNGGSYTLIAVGVHYNNRINTLSTQVNDLRSQLYNVQNNLSNQIAGISNNVSDILERESSLLSQFSYEVTKVDLKKQECTLAFSLLPKTIGENTAVSLLVTDRSSSSYTSDSPPTRTADLKQDSFGYLHGEVTVPLSDELSVSVNFKTHGETQSEELDTIYNLKTQNSPVLYSFNPPFSYMRRDSGSPLTYQLSFEKGVDYRFGSFTLGVYDDRDIRTMRLEYTRNGKLISTVPLEAVPVSSVEEAYPVNDLSDTAEATAARDLGTSYFIRYPIDENALDLCIRITDSPLICEMIVELSDGAVLRVRLLQVQTIAGGSDYYEETNYLDQALEPLPFIVEYPDGQN